MKLPISVTAGVLYPPPGLCRTILFLLLASWNGFCPAAEPARPPNILFIMADDLGYECLSANGSLSYQTPNLDRLAAEGVRFEQCYAQPLCTPSRLQLLTGLYNKRNYVRFGLLDPEAKTIAQSLRSNGYATGIAGKWQLEGGFEGPKHFGFDDSTLWQLTIRKSRYANPLLEINGTVKQYKAGEYGPDLVSDALCAFIERNRERPFFAYYPMLLTHSPYVPTPDSVDWNPRDPGAEKSQGDKKYFGEMVRYMDKIVGKLIQKLDDLQLRENTIIIFTGDNGTGRGVVTRTSSGEVIGGKGTTTSAGMHVPLIANCPGRIPGGRVSPDLIDFTDFFPTLLELTDTPAPEGLALDGRSFAPQLRGEAGTPRESIYCWYSRNGGPEGQEFAQDRRYKLYTDGRIFDLTTDPMETDPLAARKVIGDVESARIKLQNTLDRYRGIRPERLMKEPPPRRQLQNDS
jgi:arylsulfatase A